MTELQQPCDIEAIKVQMCEIGRRLYARGYAAGNDGNLTVRIGEDRVLCSPTMHSKGLLQPEDIVTIDMNGEHISGNKRRSSEALLHLQIYQSRADVAAVVHCHPPHATAFAYTHSEIPLGITPEVEMFLGRVAITPYETPGTQAFAETVVPFLSQANALVLANHGTVSYAAELEHAFWWTEVLDAYCKTLLLAKNLGDLQPIPEVKLQELYAARKKWGFLDKM